MAAWQSALNQVSCKVKSVSKWETMVERRTCSLTDGFFIVHLSRQSLPTLIEQVLLDFEEWTRRQFGSPTIPSFFFLLHRPEFSSSPPEFFRENSAPGSEEKSYTSLHFPSFSLFLSTREFSYSCLCREKEEERKRRGGGEIG